MTLKPGRVAVSYSLFKDPNPVFQKSSDSDPDPDFEAQNNIFEEKYVKFSLILNC